MCCCVLNFIKIMMICHRDMAISRFFWRFSIWRISAILNFRGPWVLWKAHVGLPIGFHSIEIIALNCLVFEKTAFFCERILLSMNSTLNRTWQSNSKCQPLDFFCWNLVTNLFFYQKTCLIFVCINWFTYLKTVKRK